MNLMMTHFIRVIKTGVLLLIFPLVSLAQHPTSNTDYTQLIDMLPPSPNAASLGKYGGVNVGLASGMVNINIPLQSYVSDQLSLPLSLSYSTSGLKVDEIGSRVGMSWIINAGGVITRTVMGGVDELTNRLTPPSDFPSRTQNLIDFAEALSNTGDNDGQPDIFSFNFNGYNGQFILDNNMNPVLLAYSALKIEKDLDSVADWNFKVTTPDGVQYFFGGTTATETSRKYESGCGRDYLLFVPTAWYLKRVIHPQKDTINLSYSNIGFHYIVGVSQTVYSSLVEKAEQGSSHYSSSPPNSTCISYLQTNTPLLNEINSTAGGKAKFLYISRKDIGDKLLSRIELYQPGQTTLYKFYDLHYQQIRSNRQNSTLFPSDTSLYYRPFLTGIDEGNAVNSQLKKHLFSYYRLDQLPTRLSFSQDDYGYYNGIYNSSLIPTPESYAVDKFTYDFADRHSNSYTSMNGLLANIQYPTGGTDSLVYEPNTYYDIVHTPNGKTIYITKRDTGSYEPDPVRSEYFHLSQVDHATATIIASTSLAPGYIHDGIHDKGSYSLMDSTTNTTVASWIVGVGLSTSYPTIVGLGSHTYYLKMNLFGAGTEGSFNLSYIDGELPLRYVNDEFAGSRIAKVITKAAVADSIPQVKAYYYYDADTPAQSSGRSAYAPNYFKYLRLYFSDVLFCAPNEYDYYSMYSSPLNNLYVYLAPMYYTSVFESNGINFANGGTEYRFQLKPNQPGGSILGDPIQSAPYTDYSWENGLELYSCTFKVLDTVKIPVKKVFTHYKQDSRINHAFTSYIVDKKYSATCQLSPPNFTQFNAYDMASYSHFREWMYVDTVRTLTYDQAGLNYVEEINVSQYGDTIHALLTKSILNAGNGKTVANRFIYPSDTTFTGDEETGRQALIDKHMLDKQLISQQLVNNVPTITNKASYHVFSGGFVLPQFYNTKKGSSTAENRVTFDYNGTDGKLLSQSLLNGPSTAYQWGYNNVYVVAECKSTTSTQFYYEGFEESSAGTTVSGVAHTGGKYSTSTTVSWTAPSGKTYVIDYWYLAGGTWQHKVDSYTGSSYTLTVSGASGYDDIRIHPAGAQMTTYTYEPLVGMTSMTDARNNTIYYEYDSFQRLINVKDQNGNIKTHYCYNYAGQETNCPVYVAPPDPPDDPPVDPPVGVYVRVEITDLADEFYGDDDETSIYLTGNVCVKLYSDPACTIPLTLTSDLPVVLTMPTRIMDDGNLTSTETDYGTYTIPAGESSYCLGLMDLDDWYHSVDEFSTEHWQEFIYDYFLTPGSTIYTAKPTVTN